MNYYAGNSGYGNGYQRETVMQRIQYVLIFFLNLALVIALIYFAVLLLAPDTIRDLKQRKVIPSYLPDSPINKTVTPWLPGWARTLFIVLGIFFFMYFFLPYMIKTFSKTSSKIIDDEKRSKIIDGEKRSKIIDGKNRELPYLDRNGFWHHDQGVGLLVNRDNNMTQVKKMIKGVDFEDDKHFKVINLPALIGGRNVIWVETTEGDNSEGENVLAGYDDDEKWYKVEKEIDGEFRRLPYTDSNNLYYHIKNNLVSVKEA